MQEWLIGGAALGALAMLWGHIKSTWGLAKSLVITTITIDAYELRVALLSYLWRSATKRPFGQPNYTCVSVFSKMDEKYVMAVFEKISSSGTTVFWKGFRPIVVSAASQSNQSMENSGPSQSSIKISFLRWTFDPEALLLEAMEKRRKSHNGKKDRFCVTTLTAPAHGEHFSSRMSMSRMESGMMFSEAEDMRPIGRDLDDVSTYDGALARRRCLSMTPEMNDLMTEAGRWAASKHWYIERGIPWRRGLLFEGPPGSGKSSMAVMVARELDMPLLVIDMNGMSNAHFRESWKHVMAQSPCVTLIEDMDVIFDGRKNMSASVGQDADHMRAPHVSFDCMLNTIDGAEGTDGVLLIVTSNFASNIDQALRDRPGRVDKIIKFGPLPEAARRDIATRILRDMPDMIEKVVEDGNGEVGAAFTERCVCLAMMGFWKEKKNNTCAE